jgi:hypothetical protein
MAEENHDRELNAEQMKKQRRDAEAIIRAMNEQSVLSGAYCQDVDAFRVIYRYLERRMTRTSMSAYIILFSLLPEKSAFHRLFISRASRMKALGEAIHGSLRTSDLYTRYSATQYLVMLCDLSMDNAEMVAKRILRTYNGTDAGRDDNLILHYCFPLKN